MLPKSSTPAPPFIFPQGIARGWSMVSATTLSRCTAQCTSTSPAMWCWSAGGPWWQRLSVRSTPLAGQWTHRSRVERTRCVCGGGGGEGGKEGGGATLGGRSGARIQVFAGYWCGANIDVPLL